MSEPTKFIKDPNTGVRKISDEWKAWKKNQQPAASEGILVVPEQQTLNSNSTTEQQYYAPPPSSFDEPESLPIISSVAACQTQLGPDTQQAPSVLNSIQKMTNDAEFAETCATYSLPPPPSILDNLSAVFGKYETPIGLISKLLLITEFDQIEIVCDDSGSIRKQTNPHAGFDPYVTKHKFASRWEETRVRISEMFELLVWLPFPPVTIRFLNNESKTTVIRQEEMKSRDMTPPQFFQHIVEKVLPNTFDFRPTGQTPYLEMVKASFRRQKEDERNYAQQQQREVAAAAAAATSGPGDDDFDANGQPINKNKKKNKHKKKSKGPATKMLRYWFADGRPDGAEKAVREIAEILESRDEPSNNPITFMSVTDTPSDVEWMQEIESSAPFVAEYSNYYEEANEIRREQSSLFPVSRGFWLIGELVGALCPSDLDLLDEGIPLPKPVLDDIQGYICSNEEYSFYFNAFLKAQSDKFRQKSFELDPASTDAGNKKKKYSTRNEKQQEKVNHFQHCYLEKWRENYNLFLNCSDINSIPAVQYFKKVVDNDGDERNLDQVDANKKKNNNNNKQNHHQNNTNNKNNNSGNSKANVANTNYQKMEEERSQNKKKDDGCPCVIQ